MALALRRIAELDTYQRTLAAGGIELTSERSELQKEIETIQGDLQVAADFRKRGAADFETAREDTCGGARRCVWGSRRPAGSLTLVHMR